MSVYYSEYCKDLICIEKVLGIKLYIAREETLYNCLLRKEIDPLDYIEALSLLKIKEKQNA